MKTAVIVIGIVFGIGLLFYLLVSYLIYRMTFRNERKHDDISREVMEGEQYDPYHDFMAQTIEKAIAIPVTEEIRIPAYDGGTLFAKYYHVADGAPICILFHGYKGEGIRDFSGGLRMVLEGGYNAILVDERGHARSRGRIITFGIKERRDAAEWVRYTADRFGKNTPIFLIGISMGAATVLMTADMELAGNVRGILADCPYSSPEEIILLTAKNRNLPIRLLKPFLYGAATIYGHFRLRETDPVRAVSRARYPILIVHGEDDRFVPAEMSERIAKANPEAVTRETFPGAAHGISYVLDIDRYRRVMYEFIRSHLPENTCEGDTES